MIDFVSTLPTIGAVPSSSKGIVIRFTLLLRDIKFPLPLRGVFFFLETVAFPQDAA